MKMYVDSVIKNEFLEQKIRFLMRSGVLYMNKRQFINTLCASAIAGTATTIGGSGGERIVIGGEANIPTDISQIENSSASFSIGTGGGVPAEMHTFITHTFIQQIIGNGGSIKSIKE